MPNETLERKTLPLLDQTDQRIDVLCRTTEDWHPNWPGATVRVTLFRRGTTNKDHGVFVWGMDDTGMEFFTDDFAKAAGKFRLILGWDYVTRKQLEKIGFRRA